MDNGALQWQTALAVANDVRTYRKGVKEEIAAGTLDPELAISGRDPRLRTMEVEDLLLAIPGMGRLKVRKIITMFPARLAWKGGITVGELTQNQRSRLVAIIRAHRATSVHYRRALADAGRLRDAS